MSDLKHQTLEELIKSRAHCEKYINTLSSKLSGQKERLKWIDKYISDRQKGIQPPYQKGNPQHTNSTQVRFCKGCPADITNKHQNAKFCSTRCKDDYWNLMNPRGYFEHKDDDLPYYGFGDSW